MIEVKKLRRTEYRILVAGKGKTLTEELAAAIISVRKTLSESIGQERADLLIQACVETAMEEEIEK